MSRRSEIGTIYAIGLVQGLALITFPAASAVLMADDGYGLSRTAFGGFFVPQAMLAIAAALSGGRLANRLGAKQVLLAGLGADVAAMGLLAISSLFTRDQHLAYSLLLAATACMGLGFGWAVPTLNVLVTQLFPARVNGAVLALNALLGLGTVLAPVLIGLFTHLGWWYGLPMMVGALLLGLMPMGIFLIPAHEDRSTDDPSASKVHIPGRFWLLAAFALLYGICETMNATWASPYMTAHAGAGVGVAALALTIFWGMVTGGRLLFAALEPWIASAVVMRVLPLVIAGAFAMSATQTLHAPLVGLISFGLAGLGCSALLPLVISRGQTELPSIATSVAGGLIAAYQIGYGIAAFGAGPLQDITQMDMSMLYAAAAMVAGIITAVSFAIVWKSGRHHASSITT